MKAITVKRKTYRTFDSIRNDFKGDFNYSIRSMQPHAYMLERAKAIFETEDYKRLKNWQKSYIEGIRDAQLAATYLHLQWAFTYNGVYTEKLPYGPDFKIELVQESFHHYKGNPERRF